MEQQNTGEITYHGDRVLINTQFYKFWMLRKEFIKFKLNNKSNVSNQYDHFDISINMQDLSI